MLRIYEMYSISEKNSAVALLINTTPSGKQVICWHPSKNPLPVKRTEKDSFPFSLSQHWLKFNHYLTIANFKRTYKKVLVWETATDPEVEKQLNKIIDFQQLKNPYSK